MEPMAFVILAALALGPQANKGAPADLERLVERKRFDPIATVAALPDPVRAELARLMRQESLSMADPGKPFQVTDVVMDRTLPGRRLIFAGQSGDTVVVHYESGGIAHLYKLVVLRIADGAASVAATAHTKGALADLGALKDVRRHLQRPASRFFY